MILPQKSDDMEELDSPEMSVRKWPESIDWSQLGNAGRIALLTTDGTEVDPHATLFSLLTVFGGVVGPGTYMHVGEARHYLRLYVLLVGASSRGRKGSSLQPIVATFAEIVHEFKSIRTSGPLSSGEGLLWRIRDASEEVNKEGIPVDPGVEDKRLIILDGEFAACLKAMKRETNTLSAILRSAWDDGDIAPLTKTKPVRVSGGHICFTSHITNPELHTCLSESDAVNGFSNRILWVCTRRQGSVAFPPRLSPESRSEIRTILEKALKLASRTSEIKLTPEAMAIFEKAYPILTQERPGLYGSATSRAEAQVLRIAMILCLLDDSSYIREEDMLRALDIWRYADESARFIFGAREPDQKANRILDYLESGEKTSTEIANDLFQKNATGISSVLEHLQAVGKIASRIERTGKKPITFWGLSGRTS
jgi:hypothetical protein